MDGDHDHAEEETAGDPRPRARAIQSLLLELGLISTDAVDAVLATYEREVGPMNGARVVARAWTDPAYRERLLDDSVTAIQELGFGVGGKPVEVVANTPEVHNAIVCTLCSCYPWHLLGLPPTWYKAEAYRSRMVREPRAVLAEFGLELGDEVKVKVWDQTSELRHMVLPMRPDETDGMTEGELAALVTRDAMVGVARVDPPGSDAADGATATDGGGQAGSLGALVDAVDADRPTFGAPWQARAFALAVAVADVGGYERRAFSRRLGAEIAAAEPGNETDPDLVEAAYYRRWLATLEWVLVEEGHLTRDEIEARAVEFAAGDRTAAEFVEGHVEH